MFGRRQFVNELALVAAKVAQTNEIIAAQQRRIARAKCRSSKATDAEDFLETMLEVRAHHLGVHDQLLHALLTAIARPAMAY
jgi:hypothetical protein